MSGGDKVCQKQIAQVFLKIRHPVFADSEDLRHRQALTAEMGRQSDERIVFLHIGSGHSHQRSTSSMKPEIVSVTSCPCKRNRTFRLGTCMFFE